MDVTKEVGVSVEDAEWTQVIGRGLPEKAQLDGEDFPLFYGLIVRTL